MRSRLRIAPLPYAAPFDKGVVEELGLRGLHIGCGPNFQGGIWLNTDIKKLTDESGNRTARDQLTSLGEEVYYLEHDATIGFPFEPGVFDWIYSEHFIEHINLQGAVSWLKECHRLLRPGGFVRISTPDLQTYMKAYFSSGEYFFKEHHKRLMGLLARSLDTLEETGDDHPVCEAIRLAEPTITGSHFERMKSRPLLRSLITRVIEQNSYRPAFMVNQIFRMWGHQWIYDYEEIEFVARKAGFTPDSIIRRRFRQGRHEQVFRLDDSMHNDESLYVELQKK